MSNPVQATAYLGQDEYTYLVNVRSPLLTQLMDGSEGRGDEWVEFYEFVAYVTSTYCSRPKFR